jgi:aldose 1-epimerase
MRFTVRTLLVVGSAFALMAQHTPGKPALAKQSFGKTSAGQAADLYLLTNPQGMEARITNYGATLVSLRVPDRRGHFDDVVLGYDSVEGYEKGKAYFGAIAGRYANRIAHATFNLEGKTYHVAKTAGGYSLHGRFNKVFWTGKDVSRPDSPAVELTYLSKDGEEGYPGNLTVHVTYALTPENALRIDFLATCDQPTVLNLANHSYFNLSGEGHGDILQHMLVIYADRFTPVNATVIPTGELRSVKGTPLDFTRSTAIGARIHQDDEQLKLARGYDHNWVLNKKDEALSLAAEAFDPSSGRVLQVSTTQPGVQFYTGNYLDGAERGKGGKPYLQHAGFSLETQHFPDSPNQPNFPSTELQPGRRFVSTTIFKFTVRPAENR